MMDIGGDNPVTLIVKAPNQRIADQTVDCFLEWTVRKLKEHLENVYPSKPKHHHQKLIYSGKLLQDHVTLKEVLRQLDEASLHTVHLVCSELSFSESSTDVTENVSQPSGMSPPPMVSPNTSEGLRYRGHFMPGMEQIQFGNNPMAAPPMLPAGYGYSPEQYMWMQQMYAQYMTQYMQYYNNAYQTPTTQPAPAAPAENVPANQNQRNNAPAAAQVNPNMRMNAQGGMVEDDDEEDLEHRDWLDYIYFMFRFLALLSIVYFYSTISRFVAVCTGFFIIYLLQKGWFNARRNPGRQQQQEEVPVPEPREEQQQPEQQQEETQDNQVDNENTEERPSPAESESPEQQPTEQQPVEPQQSILATVWCFFSTLVTSLVPQQPPAVNAN